MPDQKQFIFVMSHRGGSGKTALSGGIAVDIARRGINTMLADFAVAGGSSSLRQKLDVNREPISQEDFADSMVSRHAELPLSVAQLPGHLGNPDVYRGIADYCTEQGIEKIVCDLPTCSRQELNIALRHAAMVLVVFPGEGVAFRSLLPFLEMLKEMRSKPGRRFQTRAVLNETSLPGIDNGLMQAFLEEHLSPILVPTELPNDPGLRRAMADGELPDILEQESPAGRAFSEITDVVLELLHEMEVQEAS